MAKNVSQRYQTAFGLRYDLECCWQQWKEENKPTSFVLGSRDISERFIVSEKLYGREKEIESLLAAFDRVSRGNTETILVAGFSGIGKTALINETHQPIARQKGYFIKGKFDQFGRNIPFLAAIQAFRDLMGQLLCENDLRIQQWREKLLFALGTNAQVIIDVIPELETIIGKQPTVRKLEPPAAQNRFNLLFSKFIRVFTAAAHPLVIFLDDLQWADLASLRLIELLTSETDTRYLLFIGAYRDNEVSAAHPLMLTLAAINEAIAKKQDDCKRLQTITLKPLDRVSLNHLIADTLSCSKILALPLSKLVMQKTKGNPFFTNQFLQSLERDKLIFFNSQKRYWQCDLAQIKQLSVTEDVVEFVAGRLAKLSQPTQKILQLAACIGDRFDLNTLTIVSKQSPEKTAAAFKLALQEGSIVPVSQIYKFFQDSEEETLDVTSPKNNASYKFLHDRIQQAAYSLIPETQKQIVHLQIGRLLLENADAKGIETNIFAIVNQLNLGASKIEATTEKQELARLNAIAGKKAKQATAYSIAFAYFNKGIELLEKNCWSKNYDLTFSLYLATAQTAYLIGKFQQRERLTVILLQQVQLLVDRVKVYEVEIYAYIAQGQPKKAIETSLLVLQLLGVSLPHNPSKIQIVGELLQTKLALHGKAIDSLIELPKMTDPHKQAAGKIMAIASSSAVSTASGLTPLLTFRGVTWSLKFGNDSMSCYGYAGYGVILCGVIEDFDAGYKFGKLALNLVEKFNANELKARTLMVFNNFIRHWREHIQNGLAPLQEAYSIGLETGDLEFAAYAAYMHCYHSYFAGNELNELADKMAAYHEAIANLHQETVLRLHKLYRQVVLNLTSSTSEPDRLNGEVYDEEKMLPLLLQENHTAALFDLYWHKMMLCYWFDRLDSALENAEMARQYLDGEIATLSVPLFHFYDSLVRLAIYPTVSRSEQKLLLAKVRVNQRKMKRWAKTAPMNHLHKFYLVEAERDRVLGKNYRAEDNYHRAIELAKEHKYINEEALIQELTGKFYCSRQKERIAAIYLGDAYYNYARWGAIAKVKDLTERYKHLLTPILERERNRTFDNSTQLSNLTGTEISMQLDRALVTSLDAIVANTGAQKGYLILPFLAKLEVDEEIITQSDRAIIVSSIASVTEGKLTRGMINYVDRTNEALVLDDATQIDRYVALSSAIVPQPQSILCLPIGDRERTLGTLYLENSLTPGVFANISLSLLNLCCTQLALSLENKILHQQLLQAKSREQEKTTTLENSLIELQEAQDRLIDVQVQLQHDAFHDSLTNLPNRAWLMRMLDHAIKLAQRHQNYLYAVLFLDLDRFKVVNDSLGHLVGDELLLRVAEKLRSCVRACDTVARFGGDEFAILLEEMDDPQEATIVAQRIQEALGKPFQLRDYEVCTGTSIGIALSTMGYQQPDELLRDADAAMYQAKSQGKGRYVIFDRGMQTQAISALQIENDLRRAIDKQEFCLYYQPIVSLLTGHLSGFEALLRWYHPKRGWISPNEFIPIAEETGLIHSLGLWSLKSACEQLEIWSQQFPQLSSLLVNVNFSAIQLKQVDILDRLQAILPKTARSGFGLKLEITESCILEAVNWEAERLKQLKELGIGLSIDDFGTGYSSLSRLHEFPIDTLKIDRAFVSRLHLNSNHRDTVQTIVTLAHNLGMDVVAEGVEDRLQLEKLKELNCEFAQGYLFSKPVNSKEATQLLLKGSLF
jgi:diguanylate cyclase (GGDEF)-like protein